MLALEKHENVWFLLCSIRHQKKKRQPDAFWHKKEETVASFQTLLTSGLPLTLQCDAVFFFYFSLIRRNAHISSMELIKLHQYQCCCPFHLSMSFLIDSLNDSQGVCWGRCHTSIDTPHTVILQWLWLHDTREKQIIAFVWLWSENSSACKHLRQPSPIRTGELRLSHLDDTNVSFESNFSSM